MNGVKRIDSAEKSHPVEFNVRSIAKKSDFVKDVRLALEIDAEDLIGPSEAANESSAALGNSLSAGLTDEPDKESLKQSAASERLSAAIDHLSDVNVADQTEEESLIDPQYVAVQELQFVWSSVDSAHQKSELVYVWGDNSRGSNVLTFDWQERQQDSHELTFNWAVANDPMADLQFVWRNTDGSRRQSEIEFEEDAWGRQAVLTFEWNAPEMLARRSQRRRKRHLGFTWLDESESYESQSIFGQ